MPKNNELYEERRVNGARLFLTRTTQKQRRRYVPISICTFDFVSPTLYIRSVCRIHIIINVFSGSNCRQYHQPTNSSWFVIDVSAPRLPGQPNTAARPLQNPYGLIECVYSKLQQSPIARPPAMLHRPRTEWSLSRLSVYARACACVWSLVVCVRRKKERLLPNAVQKKLLFKNEIEIKMCPKTWNQKSSEMTTEKIHAMINMRAKKKSNIFPFRPTDCFVLAGGL